MYPFIRLAKEVLVNRNAPALPFFGTHVSRHICWPWDLDVWMEMNNGRTLTLYDLGRVPLASRVGLTKVMREHRWGLTMAGSSVRYRRRVRMFDQVTMHSRAIGWDDRFIYLLQSMWKKGDCTSQLLIRAAVTDNNGIVSPRTVARAMGQSGDSPVMPDWVANWIKAEQSRPWPPEK